MKQGTAIFVGVLVALLGLSGIGQAQPPATVQVQGTIRAVDCRAQTVALDTPGGSNIYPAIPYIAVSVNGTGAPFCTLEQYPGAAATV